jgi:fatty-acyl-CoA synthase
MTIVGRLSDRNVDIGVAERKPLEATDADDSYIARLIASLTRTGNGIALQRKGKATTANVFLEMIFRFARALSAVGIERGSLVALYAPNCVEAIAVRYAANLLGAATSYLSVLVSAEHRGEYLRRTAPDLLVLFPETAYLLSDEVTLPIAAVGGDLRGASLRLDERAEALAGNPLPSLARPDDLAVIVSSGGTTGLPKGSWRSFAAYTALVSAPSVPGRRQLINAPLANLSQILVDVTLLGGGVVVLEDSYDPASTLVLIEAERITDLFLVEPQMCEVMDHADFSRRDLSSLRTITHIGDLAAPTLRRRARQQFGAVLVHTYGASEIGVVSVLSAAEHDLARPELFSCAGRVRPGVEVRLRRGDGGLAERGEAGLIEVRSPSVAGGYYNRPDLQISFEGGWFRSSDYGLIDDEGYLYVLGRADDVIWIGDRVVSAMLIQETLCRIPAVRFAAVIMDRGDDSWIAALTPWTGETIDLDACRQAVAKEHDISSIEFVLVDRVPLTPQGKADRGAIMRLGRDGISAWRDGGER